MLRSCATSSSGFCAAISLSRLAPSGIFASVKPFSMSMTISAGRSPKPILMPKPRCRKKSSSSLPLVIAALSCSIPAPDAVGVAVLHLRRDIIGFAIADRAQHGDPVQQFAADVAGLQHLVLRRFLDQRVDLLAFQQLDDAGYPFRIRHAVGTAGCHARAADL